MGNSFLRESKNKDFIIRLLAMIMAIVLFVCAIPSNKVYATEQQSTEIEQGTEEGAEEAEENTTENLILKKKLNNMNKIFNSLIYKNVEDFYIKNKLKKYNSPFTININKEFLEFTFERHVYIYCPAKKTYLEMKNNKEVKESSIGSPWDIEITFSKKTIIFNSNGYYLIENNGDIKGDKYKEIWNFDITKDNNFYFICKKNNNILSFDGQINISKNKPGFYEKFIFFEISENNNHSHSESNLSEKMIDEGSFSLFS